MNCSKNEHETIPSSAMYPLGCLHLSIRTIVCSLRSPSIYRTSRGSSIPLVSPHSSLPTSASSSKAAIVLVPSPSTTPYYSYPYIFPTSCLWGRLQADSLKASSAFPSLYPSVFAVLFPDYKWYSKVLLWIYHSEPAEDDRSPGMSVRRRK